VYCRCGWFTARPGNYLSSRSYQTPTPGSDRLQNRSPASPAPIQLTKVGVPPMVERSVHSPESRFHGQWQSSFQTWKVLISASPPIPSFERATSTLPVAGHSESPPEGLPASGAPSLRTLRTLKLLFRLSISVYYILNAR